MPYIVARDSHFVLVSCGLWSTATVSGYPTYIFALMLANLSQVEVAGSFKRNLAAENFVSLSTVRRTVFELIFIRLKKTTC